MYSLVIKNGYIYNSDKNSFEIKDIAIKDDKIIKISDNICSSSKKNIDAKNKIILPGFINLHIHFGEYYVKGYNKKLSTSQYIYMAEKFNKLNIEKKEEIRVSSTILSAYESIEYGNTTLMGIRGWNCIDNFGLRLYLGYPLMNSEKLREYLNNPFEKFSKFQNTKLNTYYLFLHSLQMVDEIFEELSNYLKKNKNVKFAIHLSETLQENLYIRKKYQMSPTEFLLKHDLLNSNTLLIHCCYLSDNDLKIIKEKGCTICICPNSNLKLGNKIPNLKKMLKYGINVCIGTDGSATNDSLNIMNSCKTIGLFTNLSEFQILEMITSNGNKYLNADIGSIKENYKADLLIYDLDDYRIVRKETFLNNLIYSSEIKPIYVIINGNLISSNSINKILSKEKLKKIKISNILNY